MFDYVWKKCSLEDQVPTMVWCFADKYLGSPVSEGRMKAGKFQSSKDKSLKWLSNWIEKYASSEAKEIQIKIVLQALPVYAMRIFKFLASLCD